MSIIPLRTDPDPTGLPDGAPPVPSACPEGSGSAPRIVLGGRPAVPSRALPPPDDEDALARRLAAGDRSALTTVAAWLWEPLAAYAYRVVGDVDAAMDITQEAYLRLWDRRSCDAPRTLRPYLFRMVRNLALDHVKTRRTRLRILHGAAFGPGPTPARPDEILERDRIAGTVQRAIQELPARRREVFSLAYLQGLTYAEVSDVLGISAKTVHNHMSAALAQLRITLRPLLDDGAGRDG